MRARFRCCLLALLLCGQLACMSMIDRFSGEHVNREIRAVGIAAQAVVLDIWETGVEVNDYPVVGFRLEVHAEGLAPYEAETKALISLLDIPRIQPGSVLLVKYDPNDPQRVALDTE